MNKRRKTSARAFEELLSEHLDALYGTALRLCGGREADAEDLMQDAALRAYRNIGDLKDKQAARKWLFTILVRTNLNRLRTARRRSEWLAVDMDEASFEAGFEAALERWRPALLPEVVFERERLRDRVIEQIDALPAPMRAILWLVDIEGFRQRDAAAILEIAEGTVASRLFRARRELRDRLEGLGIVRVLRNSG